MNVVGSIERSGLLNVVGSRRVRPPGPRPDPARAPELLTIS